MVKPVGEAELELTVSMLQMQRSPNPCKTSCIRFSRLFPHSVMERRTAKRYKAEFVYVETLRSAAVYQATAIQLASNPRRVGEDLPWNTMTGNCLPVGILNKPPSSLPFLCFFHASHEDISEKTVVNHSTFPLQCFS